MKQELYTTNIQFREMGIGPLQVLLGKLFLAERETSL